MFEHIALPGIILLCGLFSAVCALKDYDWFMENRRAQFFVRLIGRTATRVFYTLLGTALFVAGSIMLVVGMQKI